MADLQLFQKELKGDIVLVEARGVLDAHTFDRLDELINTLFRLGHFRLIFRLDKLEYISSAGAGVFVGAIGKAREEDGDLVILKPNPNVREIFDLLGLSQIFTFSNSTSNAVSHFLD